MRRLFNYAAALVLCAAVAACEKEKPLQELNPVLSSESVTITSGETVKVDFSLNDVRGNAITVSCGYLMIENYNIVAILNASGENGTVDITAPAMILDDTPFDVTVVFTDSANQRVSESKITVNPVQVEGLVKLTESANSFIVSPGAVALFPACKGNTDVKAGATKYAVLWQDTEGLVSHVDPHDDAAIAMFAEEKEGNAVIAGLDDADKVVWSWHFWVTKNAPKDVTVGGYTFMDRNVGALTLDEKSDLSIGVVYQYGRKDPFPGIKYMSDKYGVKTIYNAAGQEITIAVKENVNDNNIQGSIAEPDVFFYQKHVSGQKHNYSWITKDATTFGADNFKALWENDGKKSVYDPCPAGYKVASIAAWEGVKSAKTVEEIWDNDYVTWDNSAIGTYEKYIAGNKRKVQFRGCIYDGLKLTATGEINTNTTSGAWNIANCVGKALPTAEVWCADIEPNYVTNPNTVTYFRGTAVKVNTTGNGNFDDISAIKVNALSTGGRYGLHYALPVRCVREK